MYCNIIDCEISNIVTVLISYLIYSIIAIASCEARNSI